ncbi:unnamed protein product [Cyprideis torosa]|uniref:Uncharacterized protein n=1 Tax=Cyprideis torosa TaxID=163714 RepID=A0A7R8WPZ9_9CRUS|nr:unnamed protein product [Cyprideis torosa]CAG0906210.1 unnamed protein product [Cyprideis torosa]
MPSLIDSHCHLDDVAFDGDRDRVLARARDAGIEAIVIPATHRRHWPRLLALCAKGDRHFTDDREAAPGIRFAPAGLPEANHQRDIQLSSPPPPSLPRLFPALGLHPIYSGEHRDDDLQALADYLDAASPVAIGEIGLDYFVADADRARQQHLLEAQLALAEQHRLPVILHCRKAHDALLMTLKRFNLVGGIAHAFNGSFQQAGRFIELGFHLGYGGMLTYERSRRIRDNARRLPLDAIVLETDAPDMVVSAHHGGRNEPGYLPMCLDALAGLRGVDRAAIAAATTANAKRALALPAEN